MSKSLRKFLQHIRKWEGVMALAVFGLFFISSMLLSQTVQALNKAAGNYGYYLNTYGYQSLTGHAVSDYKPNRPTSLTATANSTASLTFSWTAPTGTDASTTLDNLSGYCYTYSTTTPSNCTLTDSTTSTASVTLTGLTAGTTYNINVRAYDSNSNLSATALTGSGSTNRELGGGGGGGSAGSVSGGSSAPAASTAAPAAPATPAQGTEAVAPLVSSLKQLSAVELGDPKHVADSLGANESAVRAAIGESTRVATAELKLIGIKLGGGELAQPLSTTLAALGVVNPELSTERGKQGFVRDIATVLGASVLKDAQKNSETAKIVVEIMSSTALGAPLDRRTIDQQCKLCGKVLLSAEQAVVKDGVFQKMLGRLPKSAEDFNVLKVIAYRGRVVNRDTSREVASRVLYEQTFGLSIAKLAKSTKAADVAKVGKAWSVVRALAASTLDIPVKKAAKKGKK